jgi:hypothetical protein
MKILGYVLAVLAAVMIIVFVIGFTLPETHAASVRADYRAPAERIYAAIADVEKGPAWRSGLEKVEVLRPEPLEWRETADWGTITFVRDEALPSTRIKTRIADESQGFGGTWTYEITPAANGTTLTITENGTVKNPIFRFMSRFIFGHYKSLETYASDLGKHLGESVTVSRVQ